MVWPFLGVKNNIRMHHVYAEQSPCADLRCLDQYLKRLNIKVQLTRVLSRLHGGGGVKGNPGS